MISDFGKNPIKRDFAPKFDNDENEEYIKRNAFGPSQWLEVKHGSFIPAGATKRILSSGAFTIKWEENSNLPLFEKIDIRIDKLTFAKNKISEDIIKEVKIFWEKSKEYENVGYLHRRGFLLYGQHGAGKTSLVHQIIKDLVDDGGLVFICANPRHFTQGIKAFRKIEPKRKVICLFEDIDATIKHWGEQEVLSLLDGEDQIDYVFNLATTNYPELLDKRIVARPRRFDRVIKVCSPTLEARFAYFKSKLKKEDNPSKWAKESKDLSFASLAELVIAVKCFNEDFNKTIERLKRLKVQPSSEDTDENIGFG